MRPSKAWGIAIALLVTLSLILSACSGAQSTSTGTNQAKPAEPTKAAEQAKPAPTSSTAPESSKPSAEAKPASKAPSGEPIKIGAILPVSGQYAPMGDPMKKSIELAQETINAAGGIAGRPLQLVIYDDEADQAKSLQLTDRLINEDKVVAIIGPVPTACAQGDTQEAEKYSIPEMYSNPTAAIWKGKKYIFHINHDDNMQAEALVNYIDKKLGKKSIAILYDANPYGSNGSQLAKAAAEKRGLKVTDMEKYGGQDRDVTPQLTKIKDSGAEALVIWGVNPVPAIAVKQLRQLGSKIPVVGSDALYSPVFIQLAGDAAEGTSSVTALNTDHPDAEQSNLVNLYKAKYNTVPPLFAAFAWDATYLFKAAIENAGGKTDANSIVQGLTTLKGFKGAMGPRNFTADNHNGLSADSLSIAQVKDGKWITLPK